MMMKWIRALALSAIVGGVLSGCGWKTIPYTPNPAAVRDPAEDFQRLVSMAKMFRPTRVEMSRSGTFASLFYIGTNVTNGVDTVTVPFGEIRYIELLTARGEFVVRATDASGERLYDYVAMDEAKARQFADVLAALAARAR